MAATQLITGIAAFKTLLDGVLSADPPNSSPAGGTAARIRDCSWSQGPILSAGEMPFLALQVLYIKRVGVVDGNTEWEVGVKIRVVWSVSRSAKAHDDSFRYMTQIENLIDGWMATGCEGGEAVEWNPTLPPEPSQGSLAFMECERSFRVQTARGAN